MFRVSRSCFTILLVIFINWTEFNVRCNSTVKFRPTHYYTFETKYSVSRIGTQDKLINIEGISITVRRSK